MIRPLLILFAALCLTGCAPIIQKAGVPGADFTGPRITDDTFVSFDGAKLGLKHWDPPAGAEPSAVIVGLHGINDYSNAFHLAAPYWASQGIATYAYDQRGYGRSPHRGVWPGERLMTEDLRTFCALIRQRYPNAILVVAGVSMGGAVAIDAFASDRPPTADKLVLLAPAVWGWSTQPAAYKTALWLVAHVTPRLNLEPPDFIASAVYASDNIDELRAMGRDPLMLWGARADAVYGLVNLMQDASTSVAQLKIPTLYLSGAHDELVPAPSMLKAAHRLPEGDRTGYYANGWHLLLVDHQAPAVWRDVESYIRDSSAPLPSGVPPIPKKIKGG
jgi:acylglycerol lipase